MKAKILSLNVGVPQLLEWEDKSVVTSMLKVPVPELKISMTSIEGDSFANARFHGISDSVLYVYGRDSIEEYLKLLGRTTYKHGELGENITLDLLNENDVSVGDRFQIGEVVAEATFPRIPCSKVNIRMRHPLGQKAMIDVRKSGVYLRIIKPGVITMNSSFERISKSRVMFSIANVYEHMVGGLKVTRDVYDRAMSNGAFPADRLANWAKLFAE